MAKHGAGELISGDSILQLFRVDRPHLAAIYVDIGTFSRVQGSRLTLRLHECEITDPSVLHELSRADASERTGQKKAVAAHLGAPITETTECVATICDNTPLPLFLPVGFRSEGRAFVLHAFSPDATVGNAATIWLSDEHDRIPGHLWASLRGQPLDSAKGVTAALAFSDPVAPTVVPPGLLISTTTQCNVNCIHCISRWSRGRANRLTSAMRADIERWCREGLVKTVASDYSGDLLWSDSRFGGDLDFFLDLNVPFEISTNGICLTRDVARRLMASKVRAINVSLDAGSDATFRRIRKGSPPLLEVAANIRLLVEARAQMQRDDVVLSISFALMRSNLGELTDAIRLAHELGVGSVFADHFEVYSRDMAEESLWHDPETFNAARERALAVAGELGMSLYIAAPFEPRPERRGHTKCDDPWQAAMVLGNGDVNVCCIPGPGMKMGNLSESTMEEIWNGPNYRAFRQAVNSANPPPACSACPRRRMRNNRTSYFPLEIVGEN